MLLAPPPAHDETDCRPLSEVGTGCTWIVRRLVAQEPTALRLRELGLTESAVISLSSSAGAVIARVKEARICLSQELAALVIVAPAAAGVL